MDEHAESRVPPRRRWLLGLIGACVVAGIGWSALRRRRAPAAWEQATNGLPQLLDFGMDVCEQCKKTRALLGKLEPEYAGRLQIHFVDVRDDANDTLMRRYGVRLIPLLVLLGADGRERWRNEGFPAESVLRAQIASAMAGG